MDDDVLTYEEAAAILKVSERTLERWVREGRIEYIEYPARGAWSPKRFLRSVIVDFLRKHTVRARKVS